MKFIVCLAFITLAAVTLAQDDNCPDGIPELFTESKKQCFSDNQEAFQSYQQADAETQKQIKDTFLSCIQEKMEANEGFRDLSDECLKEVQDGATEEEATDQQRECLHKQLQELCPKIFSGQ